MNEVSKRRAIAELKQKISGKRNDGFGVYDGVIFGVKEEGFYGILQKLEDVNEYNKFYLGSTQG